MSEWTPPDAAARERITGALDANLLVEAGAGAGKTTMMIERMVALIRTGRATADQIAAVTFTRKAAAELRERFQDALEAAFREAMAEAGAVPDAGAAAAAGDAAPDASDAADVRTRLQGALDEIDGCFIGTIHSFCARLLRERPLEAGVPPGFRELSGPDEKTFRDECWARFLERLAINDSRFLPRLDAIGLEPRQLEGLFRTVAANPDVRFLAEPAAMPSPEEIRPVHEALEALLNRSAALRPDEQPAKGWDKLQEKVGRLLFSRAFPGWDEDADFFDALADAVLARNSVTQIRWGEEKDTKDAAKALGKEWDEFGRDDGTARRLLNRWLAFRYPLALRFARAAAAFYAAERRRAGWLDFQDLLGRCARLLRSRPDARRALGQRYPYLLVDEFQDTDPVQAEVLLLLAAERMDEPSCWKVAPRPGSLFVVGDPKQSIYRFRRADISVYNRVRKRFTDWRDERGAKYSDLLALTANFRSASGIGAFVNAAFKGVLPPEATEEQAAFARVNTVPASESDSARADGAGVYFYRFPPAKGRGGLTGARISEPDAARLASWIHGRVQDAGERSASPGDFLILARRKGQLAEYARELERRGIPVDLSGAGPGATAREELAELLLLLRSLADPGNPVLCLAVLEGLFFGLDHPSLYRHVRFGGNFDFVRAGERSEPGGAARTAPGNGGGEIEAEAPGGNASAIGEPEAPGESGAIAVTDALLQLRDFHERVRRDPADVVVPAIAEALGLLPYAAGGELGGTRTRAILSALDRVRDAALDGRASLADAIQAIERLLEDDDAAPDAAGSDAVRVMNLHKAKGLEARIVVLAYPAKPREHPPDMHVERAADGPARGHVLVTDSLRRGDRPIARPADWDRTAEIERGFTDAEEARLLYVAATRAKEELVIARCGRTEDECFWAPLYATLEDPALASEIEPEVGDPVAREPLAVEPAAVDLQIQATDAARSALRAPSYRAASVGMRVHSNGVAARDGVRSANGWSADDRSRTASGAMSAGPGGADWGRIVHVALEAASRAETDAELHAICRDVLLASDSTPDPDQDGPDRLDRLVTVVRGVLGSEIWDRARTASVVLAEVPFALALPAEEWTELVGRVGIMEAAVASPDTELIEGRIDLAFRDDRGWSIVDYKSDRAGTGIPAERLELYVRQVRLYAACWQRLTRERVAERVILFTATGEKYAVTRP